MKKVYAILSVLVVIVLAFTACMAEGGSCGTGLTWNLSDGVLTISGSGAMMDFSTNNSAPWEPRKGEIKKIIIEEGVTSVGACAFSGCGPLLEVQLPANGLTSIGDTAFSFCSDLKEIELPNGLVSIGSTAFQYSGFERITIPDTVTQMGSNVFFLCEKLQSADLPEGITSIPYSTFYGCRKLESVGVPKNITRIDGLAFNRCTSLRTISLPGTLESVGNLAFESCPIEMVTFGGTKEKANAIVFEGGNDRLTMTKWVCTDGEMIGVGPTNGTCGENLVWTLEDDVLTISGTGAMTDYNNIGSPWEPRKGAIKKIIIEEGVTSVGACAFSGCGPLLEVQLPAKGLTSIGDTAFSFCSDLKEIELPNGLVSIGSTAFQYSGFERITIPDTVTQMGSNVFFLCEKLQSADLPEGITSIPYSTFYGCRKLESVGVPKNITRIDGLAFNRCTSLRTISLPGTLESVGNLAFESCPIEMVTFGGTQETANAIAFEGGNDSLTMTKWVCTDGEMIGVGPTSGNCGVGVSWDLDGSVLTISGSGKMMDYYDAAFVPWADRKFMITEIVIQTGVTRIGEHAFCSCPELLKVTLPKTLAAIGAEAFKDCTSLKMITIPEGVASIGDGCFANSGLTDIYLMDTSLTEESAKIYCSVPENCAIHLFSQVIFDPNGDYGEAVTVTVERGVDFNIPTVEFSRAYYHIGSWNTMANGKGIRYRIDKPIQVTWNTTLYAQWDNFLVWSLETYDLLNDIPMEGGVIQMHMVCENEGDSYEWEDICDGQGNYGMNGHIELSLRAEAAEGFVFYGWYNAEPVEDDMSQLTVPTTLIRRENEYTITLRSEDGNFTCIIAAFLPVFGEPELKLPGDLTEIGAGAFRGCAAVSANVPDGVDRIGEEAFAGSENLRQIHLPKDCDVNANAFKDCGKLAVYATGGGTTQTALENQEGIFFVAE